MPKQNLNSKEIAVDVKVFDILTKQGKCNDMDGVVISNELRHYLYTCIDRIELKNNDTWWDTLFLYPKKSNSPLNTILSIMLAYRWKANEIHIVDPDNNYYKIEIPIQNLPDGWYIRVWWD